MSYRRSNDASGQEVEPSTAGASGAGDLVKCIAHWGNCSEAAVAFLLVNYYTAHWEAFPRCASHPVADYEALVRKVTPDARTIIIGIKSAQ